MSEPLLLNFNLLVESPADPQALLNDGFRGDGIRITRRHLLTLDSVCLISAHLRVKGEEHQSAYEQAMARIDTTFAGEGIAVRSRPASPGGRMIALVMAPRIGGQALKETWAALDREGYGITGHRWLSQRDEVQALEFQIEGAPVEPAELTQRLRPWAEAQGIDFIVVPEGRERRRKKFLVIDMDSTLIRQECVDELAAYVGKRDEISAITARAMAGELDFETSLRERVRALKGLTVADIDKVYEERITLQPGAERMVAALRGAGIATCLVSGGFTLIADRIRDRLGLNDSVACTLELDETGTLTGEIKGPVIDASIKRKAVQAVADQVGADARSEGIAVGDGANDLLMLQAVDAGIGFHPKPLLIEQAPYTIARAPLDALLYVLGYSDEEIDHLISAPIPTPSPRRPRRRRPGRGRGAEGEASANDGAASEAASQPAATSEAS